MTHSGGNNLGTSRLSPGFLVPRFPTWLLSLCSSPNRSTVPSSASAVNVPPRFQVEANHVTSSPLVDINASDFCLSRYGSNVLCWWVPFWQLPDDQRSGEFV